MAGVSKLIKTWHGSPHDFDFFDFSHMGKGEGAQVYGKGGYSSESQNVAEQYRDILSPATLAVDGKAISYGNIPDALGFRGLKDQYGDDITSDTAYMLRDAFMSHGGDIDQAILDLDSVARQNQEFFYPYDHLTNAIDILRRNRDRLGFKSEGKVYELGLDVDPNKMMDWREPLRIQPALIDLIGDDAQLIADKYNTRRQKRFESQDGGTEGFKPADPLDMTGKEIYRGVGELYQDRLKTSMNAIDQRFNQLNSMVESGGLSDAARQSAQAEMKRLSEELRILNKAFIDPYTAASNKLRDKGVQGIQYLGEYNRTQGEGARNYVNFNQDEMKILNKYLRPETTLGALGIQEQNAQLELDKLMGQYNQFVDRNTDAYNYGEIVPLKRSQTGRQGSAAIGAVPIVGKALQSAGYDFSIPTLLDEIVKGLADVGQSRKTGVVNSSTSLLDALL